MIKGKKIALAMGGPGSERDVSLASGKGVSHALASVGAEVVELDIETDQFEVPEGTDLVFNVIHGTFGEDGQLQKILESKRIPYTGAGVQSSETAFDKVLSKKCFIEQQVPTPAFEIFLVEQGGEPSMDLPLVMKPPREGSSVGVHIIKDRSQIPAAIEDIAKYDQIAMVEQFIQGKELTVGVVGKEVLPVVHICPRSGFYDIKNKYPWMTGEGGTDYYCPADLSPETTRRVQKAALDAHLALGIEIYSRVDVLLDADENPWVLEVNTIPGMTESSLLPKGAKAAGIGFPELCERIAVSSLKLRGPR